MKPVCLVGSCEDKLLVYLAWLAGKRSLPVVWLDEARLGCDWMLEFSDHDRCWRLETQMHDLAEGDIQGVFVHFDPHTTAPDIFEPDSAEGLFLLSERRAGLQHWLSLIQAPVINRPWAGRENASKPMQMRELTTVGLRIPRWVVTNDHIAAERFLASCPDGAVVKSCSGLRPKVVVADQSLIARLRAGTSPVVLQEYIPGREIRVHVVGTNAFPVEVTSPDIDYRFSEAPIGYALTMLPDEIHQACVRATSSAGLTLSGLDFRISDDGQWHCLEMNPVPSFLPYELGTGLPIGQAILAALQQNPEIQT